MTNSYNPTPKSWYIPQSWFNRGVSKTEVRTGNEQPDESKKSKMQKYKNKTISTAVDAEGTWITDYAWVCGVAGALTVVACAAWFNVSGTLNNGLNIFGWQVTTQRLDTILAALVICTSVMVGIEAVRLWRRDRAGYFQLHPQLKAGNHLKFVAESIGNYLLYLGLLYLVISFFHTAGEYGYNRNAAYYRGWFRFLDLLWQAYLWAGLPYVLITRAFKHDPQADRRDLGYFFGKILQYFLALTPIFKHQKPIFEDEDKKIARGIVVKLFFTPLMTVFFVDQFPHLVSNVGYLFDGLITAIQNNQYNHARFNRDFFNISIALIFSIDVALAWCGYVVSSRWVDNQTASAEPTMLGWVVCLICYPPFQMVLGIYYAAPGEREVLQFSNQWLISMFTAMMVASYIVYMASTLWFGVRFSNLTNRGIIRKGPFAFIRHPAYASKNFAWWCVMFPAIIWNATHTGVAIAVMQTLGLILMTWVYYMRAITEERHLSADPAYLDYCQQVKYRFIPKII